ncbi:MAG: glycine zipper 2TM domain-containing protein [Alphaproteobacteria bacterium]|nr:glycine zipper 2TM domain-containing protein [Alphaproteobacteria bacterium]MBT4016639.1 glycine zipper 2TM domain-containing protein [Alphaproteobacteria bacterium]MBT4966894.1 glycine zipper 2TM domain-containing protein [Alphaproteobacteria bacterium]MBT5161104.1 glycine zipper 2TM domain-containing protein [Alphaproteobacteria bacterium]MBT6387859.1 glycine zipper 2TM domain-containing protein [Alphaproteobacteria bacterium]
MLAVILMIVGMSPEKASANDRGLLGTLIGAATGAILGSNVGKGNGKVAATAVGTLIGAAIGRDISRSSTTHTRRDNRTVYPPVYRSPPARQTVIHKTRVVKHVHVHKQGRNFKNNRRAAKWHKRSNRRGHQVSSNRRYGADRKCRQTGRGCRAWN